VHALPFALATLLAVAIAPATLAALEQGGHLRANYRGLRVVFPFGLAIVAASLLALGPAAVLERLDAHSTLHRETLPVVLYVLGVACLGLVDDVFGDAAQAPRGWRGHGAAVLRRAFSTGALKAAGSLALALYALSLLDLSVGRWLLGCALVVLATNAFNLLDLRPGRAVKALALLGAGLTLGAWDLRPLWSVGLFVGPTLVAGVYDLRERAMLGDTGANLIGALAGLWLMLALSTAGQLIALGLLALLTVYGELRSISTLVERTPGLRELDSWGRPSTR
jgi:UDP-GlcNAc:undecaprenyl-phosphate/decaprenyl-phosphate GlcNAc-1-phosphate transferase